MKKKPDRDLDYDLLFECRKLYLADTLIREFGVSWNKAKEVAHIILDEMSNVQELFRD